MGPLRPERSEIELEPSRDASSSPTSHAPVSYWMKVVAGVVYQQVEDHAIAPRVMKRAIDVSPATLIVAVADGACRAGQGGLQHADPSVPHARRSSASPPCTAVLAFVRAPRGYGSAVDEDEEVPT